MKKILTISVGIPAYNEERNIRSLLDKLLSQKSENYLLEEIIVISDGSTDNTVKEINSINDSRIKILKHVERKGQNVRLNELIDNFSKKSDALLLFEADTLPIGDKYISDIVSEAIDNPEYSVVYVTSVPYPPTTFFEKISHCAFLLRLELANKCRKYPNLYTTSSSRLISKEFLKQFRWASNLHEDSFFYRKAVSSAEKILISKKARMYFKLVDNPKDYLLQSGKFQKASVEEKSHSSVYDLDLSLLDKVSAICKLLFSRPLFSSLYLVFFTLSRVVNILLPRYNVFWGIYSSSKTFQERGEI